MNPQKADAPKSFTFDAVYDIDTQQKHFYEESCYQLIESVIDGFNGTIFAYGQTGCGKTWTMQGLSHPPELRGVIPNSFDHIFQNIKADPTTQFLVRCSYLEIYNEEVRDLLSDDTSVKLSLKEDPGRGVFVKDLREEVVQDVDSINRVMDKGFQNRTVGATLMNAGSSRSHSIFTVIIEANETVEDGKDRLRAGKLNLVDLAGSERQSKTGATGDRLKEGCQINLSLSALGNVISALVDGKGKHIPYRDSKLTRLLQDSLGGNTKTLMVAAISPADYNYDETLSTLRYANRAKNIKNKPKINEDPKDTMLREYKEEISRLRQMLEMQAQGLQLSIPSAAAVAASEAPAPGSTGAPPALQSEDSPHSSPKAPADAILAPPPGMSAPLAPPGMAAASPPPGMGAAPPGMDATSPPGLDVALQPPGMAAAVVERVVERVVLPRDHAHKKQALEEYNKSILDQRNRLGEALEQKDGAVRAAESARHDIEAQLVAMKAKVMHGFGISAAEQDLEVEIAQAARERRRMQAKLRAKRKNESRLEAERLQAEMEKKEAEDELKNAREEAETAERRQVQPLSPLNKLNHPQYDTIRCSCRGGLQFDRLVAQGSWRKNWLKRKLKPKI